jgi:hypothetical protein
MKAGSTARAWAAGALGALVALAVAVGVYVPGSVLRGHKLLLGIDYITMHARRMAFAREALLGPQHTLPGWFPRELLGAPFWSNVQSFPFIPTRLIVFLGFAPEVAFAAGVALSAALTMLFTWCFARRLGFSILAASAAAFTFATCGFVASKVMVGNLPMMEAIPSLPLLLWLFDRAICDDAPVDRGRGRMLALAAASGGVALAGHPQVVVYAFVVAIAYAWVVGARRRAAVATGSVLLGVGCAGVVLVPMLLLIGRSTRILDLDRASNDWALPYFRLLALFRPWRDGFPPLVQHRPWHAWSHPDITLFWDSVVYLGLLPWVAMVGLLAFACLRRRWPGQRAAFFAVTGAVALAMALPFWQGATSHFRGTILRSPARLMYVVSFCVSLASGAGLDLFVRGLRARLGRFVVAVAGLLLLVHVADIGSHARAYVLARDRGPVSAGPEEAGWIARQVGDGRVGFDYGIDSPHNRRFDDVGFFDSIMLARPYRFLIDTSLLPPHFNQQQMSAAELRPRTLRATGVRLLGTMSTLDGLPLLSSFSDGFRLYRVDGAAERAKLYDLGQVEFAEVEAIHARLRDPTADLDARLLLEPRFRELSPPAPPGAAERPAVVEYRRPSNDLIAVGVDTAEAGFLRILESWDPGWQAAVDGSPAPCLPGNDAFLSVPVPAGRHLVTFAFSTPGLEAGIAVSLASACLLVLLLLLVRRTAPQ